MKIDKIYKYLKSFSNINPKVCIMLGSGLNALTDYIDDIVNIPYNQIDGFMDTGVKGHKGEFIFGYINQVPVLCAKGRFHYYEGYDFNTVSSIIDIFSLFNPSLSIITNSSGCLNTKWEIGNFMIANEFLDFSFMNSCNIERHLTQKNQFYKNAKKIAYNNKIKLYEGTYTYTMGPSYETPSEIKRIAELGGSAVGMSTFPEFLKCEKLKLDSIFISCLTNYGAGINDDAITHDDVLINAEKAKNKFCKLIYEITGSTVLQKIPMK
tara:strand:- start:3486 stop:4283 length:798 start_codon:yes stop_codon:yes gene_type:complete